MTDELVHIVISYVPLMWGSPDLTYDKNGIMEIAEKVLNSPQVVVRGCIWLGSDSNIMPILIVENANAVFEHLIIWSETKPEEWFKAAIIDDGPGYAVLLMPNIEKSLDRYCSHHGFNKDKIRPNCKFLFRSIVFESPLTATYKQLSPSLQRMKAIDFGMIDFADPQLYSLKGEELGEYVFNNAHIIRQIGLNEERFIGLANIVLKGQSD